MNQSRLNQITDHVYWLSPDARTDRPVLGAIMGKYGALIVDAGNSPAHAALLLDDLSKIDGAHPKYVVLTHWHWDHVFGMAAFDVPVIAHQETKRVVEQMAQMDWSDAALDRRVQEGSEIEFCRDMMKIELPDRSHLGLRSPDISFVNQVEFDLGGVTCLIKHVGGDHSDDSSIVYIPGDNVVFLGDCLYEDLYHGPGNYTTRKLFPLIEELLNCNADYYLFGHESEPMPQAQMIKFASVLKSIGRKVDQLGEQRELILKWAEETIGKSSDEDYVGLVDAFLAGLRQ